MDMISVVIPARDAEAYLREAIDSVLGQNYPAMEVLVVNNDSRDRTVAIANAFGEPVVCLHSAARGHAPTLNHGIRHAKGNWLAFIDADDVWVPHKLSRQMQALHDAPELDAVFGHALNFSGPVPHGGDGQPAEVPGTMLIRRDAFHRVGHFDETFALGSIIDWYLRAQEAGLRMRTLPETLLYRRIHGANISLRLKDEYRRDYARILKASLDRRRKRTP
ncbi:MAG: glycosyltransferase family A protein [Chromatiales bacterium]|nr:glycosyltransferase family A protein [Chromatiales bacterium]